MQSPPYKNSSASDNTADKRGNANGITGGNVGTYELSKRDCQSLAALPVDLDAIPAELRALPNFALWRKEPRYPGEQPTKIPYCATTLRRAKSNDSSTWATFDVTAAALARHRNQFAGMGIMLAPPIFGVDLDCCRDPSTGLIVPRAKAIIDRLNTYTEISQSLCGVKMFANGEMPSPTGKNFRHDPWGSGSGGIEFYQCGRFFALTGNRLAGTPATVENRTAELAQLFAELYPAPPTPPRPMRHTGAIADDAAVHRAAKYMARIPASISGQGGHDRLLHCACVLLRFGLSDADALALLHEFNLRADPPWDHRELERKLNEAHKLAGPEFGSMLADRAPINLQRRHPRRIVAMIGGGE